MEQNKKLPAWIEGLFIILGKKVDSYSLIDDLRIEYQEIYSNKGSWIAYLWITVQTFKSIPQLWLYSCYWRLMMLANYIRVFMRNLVRLRLYATINILGLSIGIAICIMVYLFVAHELSFDKFHENGDRLFRVIKIGYNNDTGKEGSRSQFMPPPMGPQMQKSIPEIQYQARFVSAPAVVRYGNKMFRERISMTDSQFFKMFSFPFKLGNQDQSLLKDHSLVLTSSCAKKYFGEENPVGKRLTIAYGHFSKDHYVIGVVDDIPSNSSLQFDVLINISNLPLAWNNSQVLNNWNRWALPFFVQLHKNVSPKEIQKKLSQFLKLHFSGMVQTYRDKGIWTRKDMPFSFSLQKIEDIYLDSRVWNARGTSMINIMILIAFVILFIASFNFMNLSVAMASTRSLEVGIRKVLGAQRKQLKNQFWSEAQFMSILGMIGGLVLAGFLLPTFNALSGKSLTLGAFLTGFNCFSLLGIALVTGFLSGNYPAMILSRIPAMDVLKKKLQIGRKTILNRSFLVIQFTLSIALIVIAVVLGKQVIFMTERNLGYDGSGLMAVYTQSNEKDESERIYNLFRNEVGSHGQILGVTASNREFGIFLPSTQLELGDKKIHYRFNRVDPDFLQTMGVKLVRGRDFFKSIQADQDAILVNQQFIGEVGKGFPLNRPLGDAAQGFPYNCRIIGVMEDFHFQSLREKIQPLLLYVGKGFSANRDRFSRIFLRIKTEHVRKTIQFLEKSWQKVQPDMPFSYYFQDDALKGLYNREKQWRQIVEYASILSIILSCLGIFGLTALTLSRRIKEIGIRKVLGAKVSQVVHLIVKEFIVLVVLANLLAWPIAYYVMARVLQNYPYRITIGFQYFLYVGVGSILLTLFTILYLSIKAAMANPVDSLRSE
jgi:putative ABC transport system permease protein